MQSGYAGGHLRNPTYEQVCSGVTGHAEVVQMVFDPSVIAYRELLEIFFCIHDPTTLNRQGADVGSHYRAAIYTHSNKQIEVAQTMIDEVSARGQWNGAIVTEIQPLEIFFPANAYHKDYYQRNSAQPYCRIVRYYLLFGIKLAHERDEKVLRWDALHRRYRGSEKTSLSYELEKSRDLNGFFRNAKDRC